MGFVTNLGVGMGEQLECWLLPPPELKIFPPPPGLDPPPPCGDEEIGMNMFCLNPCSGVKLPGLTPPERGHNVNYVPWNTAFWPGLTPFGPLLW